MKLAYIVYSTRVYGKYSFFEYNEEKRLKKRASEKKRKKRKEGSVVRRKLDNKLSNKINR